MVTGPQRSLGIGTSRRWWALRPRGVVRLPCYTTQRTLIRHRRDTRRWNTAVDVTREALDQLCDAMASGDSALAAKVSACAGDAGLIRRFVLEALGYSES